MAARRRWRDFASGISRVGGGVPTAWRAADFTAFVLLNTCVLFLRAMRPSVAQSVAHTVQATDRTLAGHGRRSAAGSPIPKRDG